MLFSTVSALAVLAIASQAVANDMTYQVSARELFGLDRRDDNGYQPTSKFCKNGNTCAEACGAGYITCPSSDNAIHCYNQSNKEICCSDGSGNSCDPGFYCASHATNGTLCCPQGKNTDECAKSYGLTGPLVSQSPAPTSYPTSTPSSSTHVMTYAPGPTYPASNTTSKTPPPTSTPATVPTSGASVVGSGAAVLLLAAALAALL